MQSFKVLLLSYQNPDFGRRLIRAENVTFHKALLLNQWFLSSELSLVCPLTLGEIRICVMLPRKPCFHALL